MKTLLKNGTVVNVFTGELEKCDVLIDDKKIIGVGDYSDNDVDIVENIDGKFVCPGCTLITQALLTGTFILKALCLHLVSLRSFVSLTVQLR